MFCFRYIIVNTLHKRDNKDDDNDDDDGDDDNNNNILMTYIFSNLVLRTINLAE
jgi:hypothetical protein